MATLALALLMLGSSVPTAFGATLEPSPDLETESGQPLGTTGAPDSPGESAQPEAVATITGFIATHCRACHAEPSTTSVPIPGASDLSERLARRDPTLLIAGDADRSRIYQVLFERHGAPWQTLLDVEPKRPSASSVADFRRAIEALRGETGDVPCSSLPRPASQLSLADLVSRDAAAHGHAPSRRYLSLANLTSSCSAPQRLDRALDAIKHGLMGLTWWGQGSPDNEARPVFRVLSAADRQPDVLVIDIDRLGWSAEIWDEIAASAKAPVLPASPPIETETSGPATPSDGRIIAADAFLREAKRHDAYSRLLNLPGTVDELANRLGIEDFDLKAGVAATIGDARMVGAPRRVSRWPTRYGALWLAETQPPAAPASVTPPAAAAAPARAQRTQRGRAVRDEATDAWLSPPTPAGQRALLSRTFAHFHLPSGVIAFAMFEPDGRLAQSAAGRDYDADARACATCHAQGPRLGSRHGTEAQPPPADALTAMAVADREAINTAQSEAFGAIARWADVVRMLNASESALSISAVAASAGLTVDELSAVLSARARAGDRRAHHLASGNVLPRRIGEHFIRDLLEDGPVVRSRERERAAGDTPQVQPQPKEARSDWERSRAPPARGDASFETGLLTLRLVQPGTGTLDLAIGTEVAFEIETDRPCFPTLINVDVDGRARVLFPSAFEPATRIEPGTRHRVPGHDAPYALRTDKAGRDRFIALCSETEAPILAILPDPDREVFSLLGDWVEHLERASVAFQRGHIVDRSTHRRPGGESLRIAPVALLRTLLDVDVRPGPIPQPR
ncbi:MAG: DUF4384 domain-containing protein [Hyphomicrobiaceae bacterium]